DDSDVRGGDDAAGAARRHSERRQGALSRRRGGAPRQVSARFEPWPAGGCSMIQDRMFAARRLPALFFCLALIAACGRTELDQPDDGGTGGDGGGDGGSEGPGAGGRGGSGAKGGT